MSEGILIYGMTGKSLKKINLSDKLVARKGKDYYAESKRLNDEVMKIAETLKDNPMKFTIHKDDVDFNIEITKTDLKTVVGKNITDDKFNAIKNAMAKDLQGFLKKSDYLGFREPEEGKHPETSYFHYFHRNFGISAVLVLRKLKYKDIYKPYCIMPYSDDFELKKPPK